MKKQANRAVLKMLRDRVTALPRRPFGRFLLMFLCGAAASLALPPAGFLPAALFFSVPVIFAVNEARPLRGAVLFAAAGFGWFTASLYWIGHALFIKGGVQLLLLPFACLGLPLLLSLFWAMAAYLALRPAIAPVAKLVLLAGFWGAAEWLRSVIFTGFPWNVTGHIFAENLLTAQMAAFTGQHGLNLLAGMLIIAAGAVYLRAIKAAIFLCLPLFLLLGLGIFRLAEAPLLPDRRIEKAGLIRLVQPNIPQAEKWDRARKAEHIKAMTARARRPERPAALTILPEAAIAGFWRDDEGLVRAL
ncbi:MAG: hypothetical protein VXW06_00660, partial [Pseudomonadota bacterium]|nr:hypothetical protein [Pseudomonadota bacterium]